MRYIVKGFTTGEFGVYDTKNGSYPVEGPELRKAGLGRLAPWYPSDEEPLRIAAILNGGVDPMTVKAPETDQSKGDDDLRAMAEVLLNG